jgi:hypothetical protein
VSPANAGNAIGAINPITDKPNNSFAVFPIVPHTSLFDLTHYQRAGRSQIGMTLI